MPPAQQHPGRGLGPKTASVRGRGGGARRPNALARFQHKSFRFSSKSISSDDNDGGSGNTSNNVRRGIVKRRGSSFSAAAADNDTLPEEGSSLHHHFQTCPSLSRIREEFRATMEDASENKKMGFGLNCCARPEDSTGRLLVHSIGLNANLIVCGGGGSVHQLMGGGSTAVALSRVSYLCCIYYVHLCTDLISYIS